MSDAVTIALIAVIPPTLAGIVSIIVSLKNTKKLDVIHESVNGKMEKLLAVSKVADTATGKEAGKAEEKQDQKERDDKK